jgi:dihydrofolate synthase / folylpolyglutamate synthase
LSTRLRSYRTVCEELDRRRFMTLGLEHTRWLLDALDNPQRRFRSIQVVGTNGKGTTAVAAAGAFEAAGVRSGTYLSPHVRSYTERVMVGGEHLSEEEFARAIGEAIEVADRRGIRASQFELLTAGAIKAFAERGLEWAVLEAGLGARYDATSAGESELLVLTNVSLDHTAQLGDTVEEIAAEKLAPLKRGMRLLLGTDDERVLELARRACSRTGAEFAGLYTESLAAEGLAPYQRRAAALGIRAAELALGRELGTSERRRAVRGVRLPARFEVREYRGVPVVVDGGHNPAGIRAALAATRERFEGPVAVVFGVLRDKDIASMLGALRESADLLLLVRPANERAAEPEWVLQSFGARDAAGREARIAADMEDALESAVAELKEGRGVVLVTGSLYTCARVWEVL